MSFRKEFYSVQISNKFQILLLQYFVTPLYRLWTYKCHYFAFCLRIVWYFSLNIFWTITIAALFTLVLIQFFLLEWFTFFFWVQWTMVWCTLQNRLWKYNQWCTLYLFILWSTLIYLSIFLLKRSTLLYLINPLMIIDKCRIFIK